MHRREDKKRGQGRVEFLKRQSLFIRPGLLRLKSPLNPFRGGKNTWAAAKLPVAFEQGRVTPPADDLMNQGHAVR